MLTKIYILSQVKYKKYTFAEFVTYYGAYVAIICSC